MEILLCSITDFNTLNWLSSMLVLCNALLTFHVLFINICAFLLEISAVKLYCFSLFLILTIFFVPTGTQTWNLPSLLLLSFSFFFSLNKMILSFITESLTWIKGKWLCQLVFLNLYSDTVWMIILLNQVPIICSGNNWGILFD